MASRVLFGLVVTLLAGACAAAPTAAPTCAPVRSHEAPELEVQLPDVVAGRRLLVWSVRWRCWLSIGFEQGPKPVPSDHEELVAALQSAAADGSLDLDSLAFGMAGRSQPDHPPYVIFAEFRAVGAEAGRLGLTWLYGSAGFVDLETANDLSRYEERVVGGKQVHVGTTAMLAQDEHQRGRPYLYTSADYLFIVVADEEAWAADALHQLP